jgi:hypothetical protein
MSESRRKRLAALQSAPVSILERIARAIDPTDRPKPKTHSAFWHKWIKAQKPIYSRVARYYPTPSTQGDRTGIKFQDGTKLLRRADGSLRRLFPRVRRTGRIRRAEKALRRLNVYRRAHGQAPI